MPYFLLKTPAGCSLRLREFFFFENRGIGRNVRVGVSPYGAKTTFDTLYNKIPIQSKKIPTKYRNADKLVFENTRLDRG